MESMTVARLSRRIPERTEHEYDFSTSLTLALLLSGDHTLTSPLAVYNLFFALTTPSCIILNHS